MPRLIPTCCMEAMDMDMVSDMAMVATAMDMDLDTMAAMDILDTMTTEVQGGREEEADPGDHGDAK